VAAHSITNVFYILHKQFSSAERRRMLLGLCDIFNTSHFAGGLFENTG
jgi:hypothetical protein